MKCAAVIAACVLFAVDAFAQIVRQVRDTETDGAFPLDLLVAGDKLFYLSASKTKGEGLWVTDGTAAGTLRVPIPGPGAPGIVRQFGGIVYANAGDGSFWRTDGTAAGTSQIFPGKGQPELYSAFALGKLGSRLVFCADNKIWALDEQGGTPEMLADTPASGTVPATIGADGRLYFAGGGTGFAGYLWSTDGTLAGTQKLGGVVNYIWDLARVGQYIFLNGGILGNSHPYRADGTVGGITEVVDQDTGRRISHITFVKTSDELFIVDQTYYEPARIYATSDGKGARLLTETGPNMFPPPIHWLGDALYYNRSAANVTEVWKSDGTRGSAMQLSSIRPPPLFARSHNPSNPNHDFIRWGDYIYYFAATEELGWAMWRMHANGGGAELVADLPDDRTAAAPRQLVLFRGALYFSAHDGREGRKLWRSDGTAKGTGVALDSFAGSYTSFAEGLKVLNDGRAYFLTRAQNGYDMTVWRSDGTQEGTVPILAGFVSPPTPGGEWPSEGDKTEMFEHNGVLYITGNDGVHGHELWRSDGTPAGTFLLKDIYTRSNGTFDPRPTSLTLLNGEIYFAADDSVHGWQIWKTDGTTAGTLRVSNFGGRSNYMIHSVRRVGPLLYFVSGDRESGGELYRSDGTEAGTYMLKDIESGPDSADVTMLGEVNGKLLFGAGRSSTSVYPTTLWITDGTPEGTVSLHANAAAQPTEIGSAMVFKNRLYFTAVDPVHGREIWVSNGTDAGTYLFKELQPGREGSEPFFRAIMDGALYFETAGQNANRLWKTYGTPEGTSVVAPVRSRGHIGAAGGLLYFQRNGRTAQELWRSDGTTAGTFPIKLSSRVPSQPTGFAALGDKMLFFAYDGFTGDELWSAAPDYTRPHARVANISTRGYVGRGDGSLIGGFIVAGNGTQSIAVRALGGSLRAMIPDALENPELTLFDANGMQIGFNADWRDRDADALTAVGLPLLDDLESGIVAQLQPGSYTARVTGAGETAGVGLVEVYNLGDAAASSRLANISTRGDVRGGDEILIAGFIIDGAKPRRLVVRALGESLTVGGAPVPNRLADATLQLFDGNGTLLADNDDWRQGQASEITATQLAPSRDSDAAILLALPSGAYTAHVRGKNNGSGIALVEVYALE